MAHMTRDEFQKIINELIGYDYEPIDGSLYKTKKVPLKVITKKIEIGGMEGGNCWGNEPELYTVNLDPDDLEFTEIDNILENVSPKISFLEYKKLQKLIEKGEYTEREYYGNYIDYLVLELNVDKFYNFLIEHDLI